MAILSRECRGARLAGVFLVLTTWAGLCPAESADAVKTSDYNIILVVVDCLRADHLSCYGYHRKTSPHIDLFAGKAAVFRQAISQAPNTLLSFSSIFTSRYVSSHGVDSLSKALSASALTLAEVLKIYNYQTAAFVGGVLFNPIFRLDQGFDTYFHVPRVDASFKDTFPKALEWAKEKTKLGEKFFLVVHGNDLHMPYSFPASALYSNKFRVNRQLNPFLYRNGVTINGNSLSGKDREIFPVYKRKFLLETRKLITLTDDDVNHIVARYDEGINYVDSLFGGFVDELRAKKLLDRTIIILTADHGEGLFDHDYFFHDFNLYENTLHVPLIVKVPGLTEREISRQVQLIDLMPTVLELAGIPVNRDAQGSSLTPLLYGETGGESAQYAFSENFVGGKALRTDRWKLILYPDQVELYDLKNDPAERSNLAQIEHQTAEKLKEELLGRLNTDGKGGVSEALPFGNEFSELMKLFKKTPMQLYKKLPRAFKKRGPLR